MDEMKQIDGAPGMEGAAELKRSLSLALRGAVFPLSQRQLVWLARENDASAPFLTLLSGLPSGMFASLAAVEGALCAQPDEGQPAVKPSPSSPVSR
jgi:hypothetical protein